MNATRSTHLQGIGEVAGKEVQHLLPGDTIMWNCGYTSTVVDCRPLTAKTWELVERDCKSGVEYTRRKRPETIVAAAGADGKFHHPGHHASRASPFSGT